MSTSSPSVTDRVKAHATGKGWTYKGPEQLKKLMDTCTMACDAGHVWQAPAASFLFPPHSGCPECTRLSHEVKTRAPRSRNSPGRKPLLTPEELAQRLGPLGVTLAEPWQGASKFHDFRCLTCEGTWREKGHMQISQHGGCPYCKPRSRKSRHVELTPPTRLTAR